MSAAVGFIGLGQMGRPMALRLAQLGTLVVCDVDREARAGLEDAGASSAATPAEVAEVAELVSVMVRDDQQVEQVVAGPDGILTRARAGTTVAIHSTVRAETAERLAEQAATRDVEVVDAPVSGGFTGAQEGRLAVMVGGSAEAYECCRTVFSAWADLIVHAGPVGSGTRMKLARNLLTFASFAAATEAQRLAEAAGVDLSVLGRVVRHSDAVTGGPGAILHRDTTAPVDPEDGWFEILRHARDLGEKDLALALDLGEQLGVDLPFGRLALERLATGLGVPHTEEES